MKVNVIQLIQIINIRVKYKLLQLHNEHLGKHWK